MATFTGTVTTTDNAAQSVQTPVNIEQIALTAAISVAPPDGPPGTTYTITAQGSGGTPPYQYAIGPIGGVQPTPVPGKRNQWTVKP